MGKQSTTLLKIGLLASLLVLGACRSSGEADESDTDSTPAPASVGSARTTASQPDPAELERTRALQTRVFYFDFDVSEFRPMDRDVLTFHARDLASNPNKRIRLEGHADERGTREYNLALGERRANGIRDFLIVNGASRSQIETVSYGEERPARRGTTEEDYQANRRVEVIDR